MDTIVKKAADLAAKIALVVRLVLSRNIQRDDIVKTTLLSLVSGRPAFLLGPPGVNKTGTIQDLAKRIDGAEFFEALMPTVISVEQLLVESTSIEEVPTAGGGKEIRTKDRLGRAANAHLMFADEIWKAEPRLLQTLLDLSKGDGVRHEGQMVKTPLKAFLAASNELPDPEGNLGAMWSRMTIRVQVNPLDKGGKLALVKARLNRDRSGKATLTSDKLTLEEIDVLRQARPHVAVPDEIVDIVLTIYEELINENTGSFDWLWEDDRRFGRVFDVMQANALLNGRTQVEKTDLAVLEWLLWDSPEQIPVVKAKIAPYCRTPLMDAQELVDAMMAPGGMVATVLAGDRAKGVQALTQCEECHNQVIEIRNQASADSMKQQLSELAAKVEQTKDDVIAVVTGMRR